MKQRSEIEQRAEDALNSLDGIQRAAAQPWLYTRIKAKLQQEDKKPWEHLASFLSRPGIAIAGLCVVLILNAFIVLKGNDTTGTGLARTDDQQQLIDSESMIASSSSFDYENLVQP